VEAHRVVVNVELLGRAHVCKDESEESVVNKKLKATDERRLTSAWSQQKPCRHDTRSGGPHHHFFEFL
jgi:hypothetical protein